MAFIPNGTVENSCAALLTELQLIWDELGEIDADRDKQLLAIEEECLQVYKRKVDEASRYRVELQAAVADSEKEVINMCTELGEKYEPMEGKLGGMPLRQQMAAVKPRVEKLRTLKFARVKEFAEVLGAMGRLKEELFGADDERAPPGAPQDLTVKKLEELREELKGLQEEKAKRLDAVLAHVKRVHSLCSVLGEDFSEVIHSVHPSLKEGGLVHNKSVSSETLRRLDEKMASLLEEKKRRMHKGSELGAFLVELWSLLDTPQVEQQPFMDIALSIACKEEDIVKEGALSQEALDKGGSELTRLQNLKSGRMKELVGKKRRQLEAICTAAHMLAPKDTTTEQTDALIESEMVDPSELLAKIEKQIKDAEKDQETRAPVMAQVEKFLHAVEQEQWLDEYNKDENRYAATKGQHLLLKRAEIARAEVKKLGGLSDALLKSADAWEKENGRPFYYNTERVRDLVEDYKWRAQVAEDAKRRQKEEEKLKKAMATENELKYGTPSPHKVTPRRAPTPTQTSTVNRRLSLGGPVHTSQAPVSASRANLNGLGSPVSTNHNKIPKGGAQAKPAKSANVNPPVTKTPNRVRKVPTAPKPRPVAPPNFVALAMAAPPPATPESPPLLVPPPVMERNFSGLALNPSGSPVKQGEKESRPTARLGDRDIPPVTSSPSYSDDLVLTGSQARSADRYDSDSDSDAHTSDYDDENDDTVPFSDVSMPISDGKSSPALRTSAERAPFSQLNMALEHARISDPVLKAPSPLPSNSPQLADNCEERRLSAIPERRVSSRY